jgi:hypothetical protein
MLRSPTKVGYALHPEFSIGKIEPPATLKRSSNFEIEKLASHATWIRNGADSTQECSLFLGRGHGSLSWKAQVDVASAAEGDLRHNYGNAQGGVRWKTLAQSLPPFSPYEAIHKYSGDLAVFIIIQSGSRKLYFGEKHSRNRIKLSVLQQL